MLWVRHGSGWVEASHRRRNRDDVVRRRIERHRGVHTANATPLPAVGGVPHRHIHRSPGLSLSPDPLPEPLPAASDRPAEHTGDAEIESLRASIAARRDGMRREARPVMSLEGGDVERLGLVVLLTDPREEPFLLGCRALGELYRVYWSGATRLARSALLADLLLASASVLQARGSRADPATGVSDTRGNSGCTVRRGYAAVLCIASTLATAIRSYDDAIATDSARSPLLARRWVRERGTLAAAARAFAPDRCGAAEDPASARSSGRGDRLLIVALPDGPVSKILAHLSPGDAVALAQTSRAVRDRLSRMDPVLRASALSLAGRSRPVIRAVGVTVTSPRLPSASPPDEDNDDDDGRDESGGSGIPFGWRSIPRSHRPGLSFGQCVTHRHAIAFCDRCEDVGAGSDGSPPVVCETMRRFRSTAGAHADTAVVGPSPCRIVWTRSSSAQDVGAKIIARLLQQ